ncbi:pre-mRNA-splicing factor 38B, putative [Plasmodium gallinaceum]|uniref:Pre-mRNA-splicing factor 38B, putative n=1 Tax=Plasmodium gallinaceum TaxID=5849 RepID=A0A1J1GTN1_PLAGA|nr:pre-mRNA-splicing factor 38B, putative [Plasmodium gallinaceum]CRG95595.1 pre-mRNA-splicing factor 38B, putative [Plasmodium gallinaceum]
MDGNYNNIEYPLYLTQTNQVDQNDINNQMYDYYYYNNPEGNNNRRMYNITNEKNIDYKNNEDYYNYNCSYHINNKNNVIYDASGNYIMNYNYIDPSYYHINNAMNSMNNPMNPIDNRMTTINNSLNDYANKTEENHKYHFNNSDPNCKLCNKYKASGNITSNSSFQSSVNHNNEEKKNCLEMTNTTTYNVNTLLRNNILSSEYFKSLSILKTYKEVVDEIHAYADHVEPYCIGSNRAPSTLFCCLYKLFTMHLSEKQLKGLIDHKDSCYIRACGFLYLRYVHSPANLWQWYESYLLDEEEFIASADKRKKVTIGEYVQSLLSDDKYFNTVLPRLPIKIKNIYGARLMIINDHRRRLKKNKEKISKFVKGEPVVAYVNGEWEKGEIGGILNHGKDKVFVRIRKIDGNEKLVNIGYVKLDIKDSKKEKDINKYNSVDRSRSRNNRSKKRVSRSGSRRRRRRSRSRSRRKNNRGEKSRSRERRRKRTSEEEKNSSHNRSHVSHRDISINKHNKRSHEKSYKRRNRSISRSSSIKRKHKKEKYENTEDELISKFRKIESQKALATGKDYARRPTSYKSSLSLKVENISTRKKSRSLSPRRINRTVQVIQKDKNNNENTIAENSKLKELIQKYNKEENDIKKKMNTRDLEEMDIMTLG